MLSSSKNEIPFSQAEPLMDVSLSSGNFLTAPIQRRRFPLNGTKLFKLQFHLPNNFDHYSLKIDRMQSNSLLEYNPNRLQTDWVLVPSLEAQEPIYQYLNFSLHSGLQSFHQNGPVSFKCIRDKKSFQPKVLDSSTLLLQNSSQGHRTTFRLTTAIATLLISKKLLLIWLS